MQVCNVLYQPNLYSLFFGVIISDCQLPNSLKTHKISQNCDEQKLSAGVEEAGAVIEYPIAPKTRHYTTL